MHVYDIESAGEPLRTVHGEVIWELAGLAIPGTAKGHSVARVVIPPRMASLRHFHPVAEETYYILKGSGRMILDGEEADVGPGQAIFIGPGQHHKLINRENEDLQLRCVCAPAWEPTNTVWLEAWRDGRVVSVEE